MDQNSKKYIWLIPNMIIIPFQLAPQEYIVHKCFVIIVLNKGVVKDCLLRARAQLRHLSKNKSVSSPYTTIFCLVVLFNNKTYRSYTVCVPSL